LDSGNVLDLGFRAYKLTTSNFKPWDGNASAIDSVAEQLNAFTENILDQRGEEEFLTEISLKSGFELTTPIEKLSLAGKTVYSVALGALLVCLDRELSLEAIEAMVQTITARARSDESTIVFKVV
jgi:adenine-specific DNA-methyltransferase